MKIGLRSFLELRGTAMTGLSFAIVSSVTEIVNELKVHALAGDKIWQVEMICVVDWGAARRSG